MKEPMKIYFMVFYISDERRSQRRYKIRGGLSNPARNWKELLPPPPEQPPTDIDSPPSSPDYVSCSGHGTPSCCQSSTGFPNNGCHDNTMYRQDPQLSMPRDKAPLPPARQHHSMSSVCNGGVVGGESIGLVQGHHLMGNNINSNIHGVPMKGNIPEHLMPNNLSNHQKELHMEQTIPLLSNLPDRTVESLATRQVFEDPRHEQLGKELLGFNDDMSQSELCCSETEGDEEEEDDEDDVIDDEDDRGTMDGRGGGGCMHSGQDSNQSNGK